MNLLPNPVDEGRLRQHVVEIGKSVYRPLSVPAQIDEMLDEVLDKANRIDDPFEQSFFAMVHLPYLQPFADVNKRTSRLAANLPLIRANLCPLTFLDVPERAYTCAMLGVYELTRVELLRERCAFFGYASTIRRDREAFAAMWSAMPSRCSATIIAKRWIRLPTRGWDCIARRMRCEPQACGTSSM